LKDTVCILLGCPQAPPLFVKDAAAGGVFVTVPYAAVYQAVEDQRNEPGMEDLIASELSQPQQLPCLYARVPKRQPQLQLQLPPRDPAAPSAGSAAEAISTDDAARTGKQRGRAAADGGDKCPKTQVWHTDAQVAAAALVPRFKDPATGKVKYFLPSMKPGMEEGKKRPTQAGQPAVVCLDPLHTGNAAVCTAAVQLHAIGTH
jgi:hypothetical protein